MSVKSNYEKTIVSPRHTNKEYISGGRTEKHK